jgi:hypothetical protein
VNFLAILLTTLLLPAAAESVRVEVHPRIEFASILERAFGPDHPSYHKRTKTKYEKAALVWAKTYAEHPSVKIFKRQRDGGVTRVTLFDLILRHSLGDSPPKVTHAPSEKLLRSNAGAAGIAEFITSLDTLYNESGFLTFFKKHHSYYSHIEKEVRDGLQRRKTAEDLFAYVGYELYGHYNIYLTTVLPPGPGSNNVLHSVDGSYQISTILGPYWITDNKARFDTPDFDERLWHEAGHGLLDPLTHLYWWELEALAPMRKALGDEVEEWHGWVKEHVVRAVRLRLLRRTHGIEDYTKNFKADVEDRGFRYLPKMLAALEDYEKQRSRYPDIGLFFPKLLDSLAAQLKTPPQQRQDFSLGTQAPGPAAWIARTAPRFNDRGTDTLVRHPLERLIAHRPEPTLLLKRMQLNYMAGNLTAARQDAKRALHLAPEKRETRLMAALLGVSTDGLAGLVKECGKPAATPELCTFAKRWAEVYGPQAPR